jgi:hypothetical protein
MKLLSRFESDKLYADTVGQHILLFAIGGQASSAVVLMWLANQSSIYYQQPGLHSVVHSCRNATTNNIL